MHIVYIHHVLMMCLICAILFVSQIDNEEYGEALSLAQAYNLDSDLVYQRQWRKSTVSIASIQDYLVRDGKIRGIDVKKGERRDEEFYQSFVVYHSILDVW